MWSKHDYVDVPLVSKEIKPEEELIGIKLSQDDEIATQIDFLLYRRPRFDLDTANQEQTDQEIVKYMPYIE